MKIALLFVFFITVSCGTYTTKIGERYVFSQMSEKMVGWEWAKLGVPAGEKITKVEVTLSSSSSIGTWSGGFGTSTSVAPDYWKQSDDMSASMGTTGVAVWNVDSATSNIIQVLYGGVLKFGIWWVNCDSFTIDKIVVYTSGSSSSGSSSSSSTTTTTTPTQTTPTTTTPTTSSGSYDPPKSTMKGVATRHHFEDGMSNKN